MIGRSLFHWPGLFNFAFKIKKKKEINKLFFLKLKKRKVKGLSLNWTKERHRGKCG